MKNLFTFLLLLCYLPLFSGLNDNVTEPKESELVGRIHFIKKLPSTPIKDQYKTSTCWSFSGISLFETELIRMEKGEFNLSEMYIVRHNYEKKADRYIRMHGKTNFAPGGETNDVADVFNEFGIVPENVYPGLKPNEKNHKHSEMDRVLNKYVEALVTGNNKELSPVWKNGFSKVLDSYLGELPEQFEYEGQDYTPESFAANLGINPDNYIMLTSFMHEPYYKSIILEIPDNWSWAESYNVPLNVLEEIVDSALLKGYSVSWATDVSEEGFNFSKGMAVVPKLLYENDSNQKTKKWKKKSSGEKEDIIFNFNKPIDELVITPELRQAAFDAHTTTDDHGMHILGLAQDKSGRSFYYVKNSWGTDNPYEGYLYVSKPYFKFKTISIMLHKEAISPAILDKLSF